MVDITYTLKQSKAPAKHQSSASEASTGGGGRISAAVLFLCCFTALGGLLFGYDIGINGSIQIHPGFVQTFCTGVYGTAEACSANAANDQPHAWLFAKGVFVASLSVGAMVGALLGGQAAARWGRVRAILVASVVAIGGTAVCTWANVLSVMIVGRVLVGGAVGVLSGVVPVYGSEVAPAAFRGTLVALMQLAIVVGILVATVVAVPLAAPEDGWRTSLALCAVPVVLLLAGGRWLPESPRWLHLNGRTAEAATVLVDRLGRSEDEALLEVAAMDDAAAAEDAAAGSELSWRGLFADPELRRRVLMAMGLQLLQQATGINSIFYFAPTIFADAGIADPLLGSLATGVTNLIGTFVALYLVDRAGRRKLLLWGAAGMALALAAIPVLMQESHAASTGVWTVALVCVFVFCFAFSWGPICWIIPPEILPSQARAKGVALSTMTNWITNTLVAFATPELVAALPHGMVFAPFAALCLVCGAFVFFRVPETKGVRLERMAEVFDELSRWRRRRRRRRRDGDEQEHEDENPAEEVVSRRGEARYI